MRSGFVSQKVTLVTCDRWCCVESCQESLVCPLSRVSMYVALSRSSTNANRMRRLAMPHFDTAFSSEKKRTCHFHGWVGLMESLTLFIPQLSYITHTCMIRHTYIHLHTFIFSVRNTIRFDAVHYRAALNKVLHHRATQVKTHIQNRCTSM